MEVGNIIKIQTVDEDYNDAIAVILSVHTRLGDNAINEWYDVLVGGEIINVEEWEIKEMISEQL